MSDITLCTPDFVLHDDHFGDATVPGDAQTLAHQLVLGVKRAAYMAYLVEPVNAQKLLELGMVNEVLPKEKLLPRAWELAEKIMKQPRSIRRLTHQVLARPWKRAIMDDYQVHISMEMYGGALTKGRHHFDQIKSRWTQGEKK